MHTTTRTARRRGHLSRHERHRLARAQAFSRRTPKLGLAATTQKLERDELELIDRLVRSDRTAVSSALLQIAGIGAGDASHRAVLERVSEAACWAQAEGAISAARSQQITRAREARAAARGRSRRGLMQHQPREERGQLGEAHELVRLAHAEALGQLAPLGS